ncbi:MAG: hypothetical protein K2W86_08010, partial [Sphingomonas sp.]|nr:hypothetical protein [Sphingomonas sp.]
GNQDESENEPLGNPSRFNQLGKRSRSPIARRLALRFAIHWPSVLTPLQQADKLVDSEQRQHDPRNPAQHRR